jgi:hypothetical protein
MANNTDNSQDSNIRLNPKTLGRGLNLNSVPSQVPPGATTYALNAIVSNFDGNSISYQNETANVECATFPDGYKVLGSRAIIEDNIKLFWLVNPITNSSEIGKVVDCEYSKIINADCLGFDVNHPILKIVYRKTECGETEVYWVDAFNRSRYINLQNLPYRIIKGERVCDDVTTDEIDCNLLNIQPDFSIPEITTTAVESDGELTAGTYQFAAQYADNRAEAFTSYYSVTNPLPIFDGTKITQDFNYKVGKSISVSITNIDTTGLFDAVNVAVIKTINNISSVELVGTFDINGDTLTFSYTGQSKTDIKLSTEDIFAKYDVYDTADDITVAQDALILSGLTTHQRISYQEIASQIGLNWQTWRMPKDSYSDPLIAEKLRGYMRDETYPFEIVFLLKNGIQTDGFHIPGRKALPTDLEQVCNNDVVDTQANDCQTPITCLPKWQVYNTGCFLGYEEIYNSTQESEAPFACPNPKVCGVVVSDPSKPECYVGPFQYGCMAYTESTDVYPCNDIYGALGGTPIRHHKFPDSVITHIHDNDGFIYPIGIKIDVQQIIELIKDSTLSQDEKDGIQGFKIVRGNRANNKSVVAKGLFTNVGKYSSDDQTYYYPNYPYNDLRADPFLSTVPTGDDSGYNEDTRLNGFDTDESKERYTFHSPDTSFYQPTLGNILKLETAEYGLSKGHFQPVEKHSRYKFLSTASYITSLGVAVAIGFLSSTIGVSTNAFNGTAAFTAMQVMLDIIEKLAPRKNFAYQYNSIGHYDNFKLVNNSGNKQRRIDIGVYLQPGMDAVGDVHTINNFQRESSIYLRTTKTLPYPNSLPSVPEDQSRYLNSDVGCGGDITETPISAYYGSIKRRWDNQYGQLYSYETIDTGFQIDIDLIKVYQGLDRYYSVFGGDVFINRFAYKSKLPFFIDNRVGFPDDADVEYDEIPNVSNPIFWLSTDSTEGDSGGIVPGLNAIFGRKINNFDCRHSTGGEDKFFYQVGKFYLFAYGIPYFYTESEVNVDLRQAFNQSEGDFFPRVSSDIPDQWLQEINTSIQQDNTYYYNKTYSKQNKENLFTHLPNDWTDDECTTNYPFRAIFSDDWYTFKPSARFDFPQNYGSLTSIDGIENKQVLARFEQKALLYNVLLTAPTSVADVYLGQSFFSQQVPPLDYADTDLGYIGCLHKLFLKTPYGDVTVDSKRGQVFLLNGQSFKELTQDTETQQVSKWFNEFLDFQIAKINPNVDNHYNGIGLTGVFDTKYNRFLLTKLDYKPLYKDITYTNNKYYRGATEIQLSDPAYFCNYSFTISYDFTIQAWVSLHTYIPNYYIGDINRFYTGLNTTTPASLWEHNTTIDKFNNFYNSIHPYIIEYPYSRQYNDEILQNIKDYSRIFKYTDFQEFIETDDDYFNKLIIYSNQQCSGIIELVPKPSHNLQNYVKYPLYNTDSKTVTFTKSGSFYQINTFWDMVVDTKKTIWNKSCENLSIYKELNQDNMDYSKRTRRKSPFRSKELKIRFILDDDDSCKIISSFTVAPTMQSYK